MAVQMISKCVFCVSNEIEKNSVKVTKKCNLKIENEGSVLPSPNFLLISTQLLPKFSLLQNHWSFYFRKVQLWCQLLYGALTELRAPRPSGQLLLPFVLPAHASVQRWRILRCTRIICFLTNANWDQSANTQCKIYSLIFSLLLYLLKNTSNEFMHNIPHHESKNRM